MSENMNWIECILDDEGCFEMETENGEPIKFELVDSMEYKGVVYHAVLPTDDEEGFVVLKQIPNDDDVVLVTVDDDNEYEEVGNLFLERFADEDEAEDEEDE